MKRIGNYGFERQKPGTIAPARMQAASTGRSLVRGYVDRVEISCGAETIAQGAARAQDRRARLSNDKRFVEKVQDIVGLYLDPPDKALVFSVDEKSQIQALDRTQPGLPLKKGRCGTMTHDYKRHGTTTLFAALDVATGKVIGQCMPRHRHQEWLKFLRRIDAETPKHLDVHLIADNYATHKGAGPGADTLATYTDDPDANTKAEVFCFVAAPTGFYRQMKNQADEEPENQMEMREAGLPPPKWSQTATAALNCTVNEKLLALTYA